MERFLGLLLIVLIIPAMACRAGEAFLGETVHGSGEVTTEQRLVSDISSVNLATTGTLHIELGDGEELRIEAQENLLPYIETEMRGNQLRIGTKPGVSMRKTEPINYYLTVIDLEAINLSSSGDANAPAFTRDDFRISISSSGDLNIESLTVDQLNVDISSSGDMTLGMLVAERIDVDISSSGDFRILGGRVEEQRINLSSSGSYDAKAVPSSEASLDINSSGSATIQVSDILEAVLSSSGDVYYIGDPVLDVRTSSSGRVIQIDE